MPTRMFSSPVQETGPELSPFISGTPSELQPNAGFGISPRTFYPTVGVSNELISHLMGLFNPASVAPYGAPPAMDRLQGLGDLSGFSPTRSLLPTFGGERALSTLNQYDPSLKGSRELMLAEPDRLMGLLDLLVRGAGLGPTIQATLARQEAGLTRLKTARQRGRAAALSQIPFLGGILGATNLSK